MIRMSKLKLAKNLLVCASNVRHGLRALQKVSFCWPLQPRLLIMPTAVHAHMQNNTAVLRLSPCMQRAIVPAQMQSVHGPWGCVLYRALVGIFLASAGNLVAT